MKSRRYCEIHVEAADESRTPTEPCGKAAAWSTDDYREGDTLWLCEEHQREMAVTLDGAEYDAVAR